MIFKFPLQIGLFIYIYIIRNAILYLNLDLDTFPVILPAWKGCSSIPRITQSCGHQSCALIINPCFDITLFFTRIIVVQGYYPCFHQDHW